MGVLDKVQQAKQEVEERLSRGGGMRAQFWKPKNGENLIRVMPPWTNPTHDPELELSPDLQFYEDQFWRQVAQHWNVNPEEQRGPILCPKETPGLEGDCPICEFVTELKSDKKNVQAQELAKEIRAKTAYLYNIVDMNDSEYTAEDVAEFKKSRPGDDVPFQPGDTKVQIYAAPATVHDAILGMITGNKRDITRLDTGRAVIIERHPNKDPKKTRYSVTPHFDASEFELKSALPALHQQGFTMEYAKMLDLLQDGVGGDYLAALPEGGGKVLPETTTEVPASEDAVDLESQLRAAAQAS